MAASILSFDDTSLLKDQAFISGNWVNAASGKTFAVYDPASGKVVGHMPEMDANDAEQAIEAAATAFPSFRKLTAKERSRILYKWYELLMANLEDLTRLITLENGKPLFESRNEVTYSADYFEWFAGEALRVDGDTIPASTVNHRIYTTREPIGVCGLITPWNWPLGMVARKVGAALAAGCTVVLKSPGETPLTSAAMAELGRRAGVPPGVVNIVTAHANTAEVGGAMTASPIVKKISFTGSTRVGKLLMKQSADTLKKLSFELGGNAPFIVFNDADLDLAVSEAVTCKFRSSGQTCVCANRIYVQRGIYDKFAEQLTKQVNSFKIGFGYSSDVTHGPLIHEKALQKVEEHVEDAISHGAKLLTGGKRLPNLGPNFYQPAVIGDMNGSMKLAREETFGPIAGLFTFDTEAEVVRLANNTEVGLGGFFFSSNIERCYRVAEALEVGMIGVNTGIVSDPVNPFGGVKESGFGREGSKQGVDEYLVTKSVTIGRMNRPLEGF